MALDVGGGDESTENARNETVNNRVEVSPSDDVQSKLDNAGVDGLVVFQNGTYSISQELTPSVGQTLKMGLGVEFQPESDIRIFNLTDVNNLTATPFRIADPNGNTSAAEAIRMERTFGCYIPFVVVDNYFNGILTSNGTRENVIGSRMRSIRNHGFRILGETHDNNFPWVFLDGATSSSHGVFHNTSGVDGGNQYGEVAILDFDGDAFHIEEGQEIWITSLIGDTCGGSGLQVNATGDFRMQANRIWASTNGNNGVSVSPGSGNTVRDLNIDHLYSWNNTNFGLLFSTGTVEGFRAGSVVVNNNDTDSSGSSNLRVANSLDQSVIGYLRSYGGQGVDVTGTITDSHIVRELVSDSIELSPWTTVNAGPQTTYTPSNVTTDRSYDADSTTTDELADVLGTLIADLQAAGIIQ